MASPVRAAGPQRRTQAAGPTEALAPMQRRVAGAAIDLVLLIAVSGITAAMLERATAGVTRVRIDAGSGSRTMDAAISLPMWLPLALLVVLTAAYTIPLMAIRGRTLGGWAVGIRCVRADVARRPGTVVPGLGWTLSTRRWFMLYGAAGLLAFAPVIGPFAWLFTLIVGLSPFWDATHRLRGYADHVGQDIVVMAPRGRVRTARGRTPDPQVRS